MCKTIVFASERYSESIAFRGNVHWETERHLELVTGGRTSTAHTLANTQDVIASTASISSTEWAHLPTLRCHCDWVLWWGLVWADSGASSRDCRSREVRNGGVEIHVRRRLAFSVRASPIRALARKYLVATTDPSEHHPRNRQHHFEPSK